MRTARWVAWMLVALSLAWGCEGKKEAAKQPPAKSEKSAEAQGDKAPDEAKPTENSAQPATDPAAAQPAAGADQGAGDPAAKDGAAAATADAPAAAGTRAPGLLDPSLANEQAPAAFKVRFTTTRGDFVVQATREWSPNGVDRFYNLIKVGFFTKLSIFRVVPGFVAQFGISGDPEVSAAWDKSEFKDDEVKQTNARGTLVFATAGPNTRTTQFFINFADNGRLDAMGFSPIGKVIEGMQVVDAFYGGYGDGPPRGAGPDQQLITERGTPYLETQFPELDYILQAAIID